MIRVILKKLKLHLGDKILQVEETSANEWLIRIVKKDLPEIVEFLYDKANCQVKCDTSCKKTSIADFQPRHFRGLELIRNRLCISSISFTRERSVFLG